MNEEIWKQYKDTHYEISNMGRCKNTITNKISIGGMCNKKSNTNYYLDFRINNKAIRAHRIVYSTFNPNENIQGILVHHLNGIKIDNRLENLQPIELGIHTSHHMSGKNSHMFKGLKGQFTLDGILLNIFEGRKEMEKNDLSTSLVYGCINFRIKKYKKFTFRRFPIGYVPIIGKKYDLFSPIFGYKPIAETSLGQLELL
jgi:hypothetical protein